MSPKERLAVALERILDRLDLMDEKLDVLLGLDVVVGDLKGIAVDLRADMDTLRSRQIEQASRDGEVIHRHQREIQEHDGRLRKLEIQAEAGSAAT
jgi:hypothetical protein